MHDDDIQSSIIGRRQILQGVALASILSTARIAGRRLQFPTGAGAEELSLAGLIDAPAAQTMCVLTPSATAGPFYLNLNLVRSDITEGQPGLRTRLNLHVVRASDCSPLPNARVEVWHTHAPGRYSGFASRGTQGQTWLRGTQFTDGTGTAFFDTIYPGWYQGRTPHIHLKVEPAGEPILTTQMYFPTGLSRRVYRLAQYVAHGQSPVNNGSDPFFTPETVMTVLGSSGGQLQLDLSIGVA